MNKEIKEILQYLKDNGYEKLAKNIENLIDYITNLQKERDNYKTSLDESQEVVIDLQEENKRLSKQHLATVDKLIETQQRIDKAIEYIEPKMINEFIHTDYIYKMIDILRGD